MHMESKRQCSSCTCVIHQCTYDITQWKYLYIHCLPTRFHIRYMYATATKNSISCDLESKGSLLLDKL